MIIHSSSVIIAVRQLFWCELLSPSALSWATSHDNQPGHTFVREVVIPLICMLVVMGL